MAQAIRVQRINFQAALLCRNTFVDVSGQQKKDAIPVVRQRVGFVFFDCELVHAHFRRHIIRRPYVQVGCLDQVGNRQVCVERQCAVGGTVGQLDELDQVVFLRPAGCR